MDFKISTAEGISFGALIVAVGAAYFARQQINVMSDQEYQQLRPYVANEETFVVKWSKEDSTVVLSNKFKNYGQTPAYNFHYSWQIFRNLPSGDVLRIKESDLITKGAKKVILYPSQYQNTFDTVVISIGLDDFFANKLWYSYAGHASYEDNFGISHDILFCYELNADVVRSFAADEQRGFLQRCDVSEEGVAVLR